ITIRYYLVACAFLPVGIAAGVLLSRGLPGDWHGRLLVAHTMVNLLGWVGLTVTGTLLTLWPTILRTRIDERAERWAKQALPVLAGGLLATLAGALADLRPVALAGVVVYALGGCWWGGALLRPARTRPPRSFSAASVAPGLVWLLGGVVGVAVSVARADSWAAQGCAPAVGRPPPLGRGGPGEPTRRPCAACCRARAGGCWWGPCSRWFPRPAPCRCREWRPRPAAGRVSRPRRRRRRAPRRRRR